MIASVESFVNLTHAHPTLGYRQQKYFLTPYHTHTSEYGALAEICLKCGVVRESHACTPYRQQKNLTPYDSHIHQNLALRPTLISSVESFAICSET